MAPNDAAPKVSYIIPCYNARRYLAECLQSVLALELLPYEIIVVDDGSTEDLSDIVASIAPDARFIRQTNQGPGAARNTGIRAASGEYLRFLDADDYLLAGEGLASQVKLLDTNPVVGLVYGQSLTVDESGRPYGLRKPWFARTSYIQPGDAELERLLLTNYIPTSSVIVRRAVLDEVGLFRTDLYTGQDYELWLRMARRAPVGYVAATIGAYRVHDRGVTATKTQEQIQQRHAVVDQLFADPEFASRYGTLRPAIELQRAWWITSRAYQNGDMTIARRRAWAMVGQAVRAQNWKLILRSSRLLMKASMSGPVRRGLQRRVRRVRRLLTMRRLHQSQHAPDS